MAWGFLKDDCVTLRKRSHFTWAGGVHCILYLHLSFIQQLVLSDIPWSVIWWLALFCLTPCWVVLLCTKTVRITLWALYLQPPVKLCSLRALSLRTSDWESKYLVQIDLRYRLVCFLNSFRKAQLFGVKKKFPRYLVSDTCWAKPKF